MKKKRWTAAMIAVILLFIQFSVFAAEDTTERTIPSEVCKCSFLSSYSGPGSRGHTVRSEIHLIVTSRLLLSMI